jgi:hypothetical protein
MLDSNLIKSYSTVGISKSTKHYDHSNILLNNCLPECAIRLDRCLTSYHVAVPLGHEFHMTCIEIALLTHLYSIVIVLIGTVNYMEVH